MDNTVGHELKVMAAATVVVLTMDTVDGLGQARGSVAGGIGKP